MNFDRAVIAGNPRRPDEAEDATLFDSTGLAIQDLASVKVALAKANRLDLPMLDI